MVRRTGGWWFVFVVVVLSGLSAAWVSASASARVVGSVRSVSVSAVVRALAVEGVGVYKSDRSERPLVAVSAPVTPLRVLFSQAQAFSAEIAAGGGVIGSDESALARMPAHAPAFAYLLAAYAESDSTPGEVLAGRLLASQDLADPERVVFPSLVGLLFAADAARAQVKHRAISEPAAGAVVERGAMRAFAGSDGGGVCASIAQWTSSALSKFFSAITLGPVSSPALSFLTGLWNKAVSLASASVSGITSALTAALPAIRAALGVLGASSIAVSALRNMHLVVTATPSINSFSVIPAARHTGVVRATLGTPGGTDVPPVLMDCASAFHYSVGSLNDVKGDKVSWTTESTGSGTVLASVTDEERELGSDHSATLSYATGEESKSVAAGTLVSTDFYLVKATVRPTVFKKLADLVRAVTLGAVPGIVSKVVGPIVKDLTSALEARITALAMPTDFRYIRITHHMACGAPGANNDFSAFGETVSCQLPTNCTTLLSPGDVPSGAEMDPTSDPTINAPSTNDGVATDPGYYSSTCVVDGSELYAGSDGSDPPQYWPVASGTYSACTNPAYPSGCAFPALAEEATDEALVSVSGIGDQAVVATLEPNATLTGDETECTAASGFDCVDYPDAPNALGEVQVGDAVFFIELQGTVETVESVLERTAAKLAN